MHRCSGAASSACAGSLVHPKWQQGTLFCRIVYRVVEAAAERRRVGCARASGQLLGMRRGPELPGPFHALHPTGDSIHCLGSAEESLQCYPLLCPLYDFTDLLACTNLP